MVLGRNSEAVNGRDKFTPRNPQMKLADACSENSKRRKEFTDFPTNSRKCFGVMDAPKIHHSSGLVVVSEFLAAIEASDVGSTAKAGSARQVGWN